MILILLAVGGILVAVVTAVLTFSPSSLKAEMICGSCGHRFEVAADEYRTAGGRDRARCPECRKAAVEPVLAVCPHCDKPIRRSQLDPAGAAYAQRLCPHCDKKVEAAAPGGR